MTQLRRAEGVGLARAARGAYLAAQVLHQRHGAFRGEFAPLAEDDLLGPRADAQRTFGGLQGSAPKSSTCAAPPLTTAGRRFIVGEPMNAATNMLRGWS